MKSKVIILGGGVAGMSAAQELVERDFEVAVYEKLPLPGGKARSLDVKEPQFPPWQTSATTGAKEAGGKPLPGEHGFRFFPGFYQHIIDTMKRIPYDGNANGVADNLAPTTEIGMTRFDKPILVFKAQLPWTLNGLIEQLKVLFGADLGIPGNEVEFFAARIWQLMTSCEARRLAEYEQLGWWEFLEAASKSEPYQRYLAHGLTRSLVAAQGDAASTFTFGDIFLHLLFDILDPSTDVDRLLNGPTNAVWLEPWLDYLQARGVDYHLNSKVVRFNVTNGQVASATIDENGHVNDVEGNYFIAALPVEAMAPLVTQEMLEVDPTLAGIKHLAPNVEWMNGLQIFLKRDIRLVHGHLNYGDSRWALTSVSQRQFWHDRFRFPDYGDGQVQGIISVVISDWEQAGLNGDPAKASTREQIFLEVWQTMKRSLIENGDQVLRDEDVHSYFLDPDIVFENGPDDPDPAKKRNEEPLLVNLVNTWGLRPEAYTRIPNLFLASDYVRVNVDLATMEGANEAARRAVNCILDASGSSARPCKIWDLHEPAILDFWRENDRVRFEAGLPWKEKLSLSMFLSPRFWFHLVRFLIIRLWLWIRKKRLGL